jgi:hypothetical protein
LHIGVALKHGDGAKFWGEVLKDAELLGAEFCNFGSVIPQ